MFLCFFWPGLKRDVKQRCKTVCQVCGKPNETVSHYPLYTIPVMCEPFEQVIVDCVFPLPRTKAGNKFILMCVMTRFPEAVPRCKITPCTVLKALLNFFSVFGLTKVIQTDQGTNFMSHVFAHLVKQLDVSHCH